MARQADRSEAFSGRATDRTSVSPQMEKIQGESEVGDIMEVGDDDDDDEDEEDMEAFWGAGEAERLKTDKEDKFVRKLVDPKAPTEKEWEDHWLMGHWPFRNWCPVCIAARERSWIIMMRRFDGYS